MRLFGKNAECDLARSARLGGGALAKELGELEAQNDRAAGIYERLYERNLPGVLLADEVGKGKTYVALAVAFGLLRRKPSARIVILTHSGRMAREWEQRWCDQMRQNCPGFDAKFDDWSPVRISSIEDLRDKYEDSDPPRLVIGSYERVKKYSDDLDEASLLHQLLRCVYEWRGIRLTENERRRLIVEALGEFDFFHRTLHRVTVSTGEALQFLDTCFDSDGKDWKANSRLRIEDELDKMLARRHREALPKQIDLLIIDEAHKLEGTVRQRIITRLLHRRFRKCIFVTATPFSLSVEQLRRRLREFHHASTCPSSFELEIDSLPLAEFAQAVSKGDDAPQKEDLERALRKYIVRSTWNHATSRRFETWTALTSADVIVPTLALERVIDGILASGDRTHIASRRESLCSSWAAAIQSLDDSKIPDVDGWSAVLRRAVLGRGGKPRPDPKMREAVRHLVKLARRGEKTVVFTQRRATSRLLKVMLDAELRALADDYIRRAARWRRLAPRVAGELGMAIRPAQILAKIIAHAPDGPERWDPRRVRAWWRKHKKRAFRKGAESLRELDIALGRGRRLPLVSRYDGSGEEAHPIEKFNLPSGPLILIASAKGQEGIDLHHYCRRVVLYDLTWNPAHMEQRIGRVHRLGGTHSPRKKVEVIYCYQEGTYEALMAKRIQERCKMLHVLLGAGQWLDADQEMDELERYRMEFPA